MKYYLLLLSLGCAVGQPLDSPYILSTVANGPIIDEPSTKEKPYDNYFDSCEMAFAPDSDSMSFTLSAVDRWSEATGCDIYVAMWGLPVTMVNQVYNEEGRPAGGIAISSHGGVGKEIIISRNTQNPYIVTAHEIGHILSLPLAKDAARHTETGLMQPKVSFDMMIDEASLELICGGLDCKRFNPERWGEFQAPEIELP